MPRGPAWPKSPASVIRRLCDALAWFWGFVDGRVDDLLTRESYPPSTVELLPDWERAWGLPEDAFPTRRRSPSASSMLVTKMTWMGGQSRQYYIDVMAWLGFRVVIHEWAPFMAGISRCGDTRPAPEEMSSLVCGIARRCVSCGRRKSGNDGAGLVPLGVRPGGRQLPSRVSRHGRGRMPSDALRNPPIPG